MKGEALHLLGTNSVRENFVQNETLNTDSNREANL